jgi:hypothetical protein
MSAPIGPGDWVECIREDAPPHVPPEHVIPLHNPVLGKIYRVERIVPGEEFEDGEPGVELEGVHETDTEGNRASFWLEQFRPVYRPKGRELFRKLLDPVPGGLPTFWREPAEVHGQLTWSGQ